MNALLWTLVILGAWNGVNSVARAYYKEPQAPQYFWSISLGLWAAALLFL